MPPLIDLTGTAFGRLTVIERTSDRVPGRPRWLCRCQCGRDAVVAGDPLRKGDIRSCGCLRLERLRTAITTHGHAARGNRHPLYVTWCGMRARCNRPRDPEYANYGERGITVCQRWEGPDGFPNFLADMGDKPSSAHSIDRINVDGDYEPSNCRWADPITQANNKRPRQLQEAA